ncbi:MAG: hypothetical protein EOO74_06205 [Myxococcales bacterium]|nr:MAG: hypothetical protein EOO74_06205 [Myxococcales bacterium]
MPGQIVLPSNPTAMAIRKLRTALFLDFEAGVKLAQPVYEQLASVVQSESGFNIYNWAEEWPEMREWLGQRIVKETSEEVYLIPNRSYEATIRVKRTEIEDGDISKRLLDSRAAGRSAAKLPDQLVANLLMQGQSKKCFDGQNFFDGNHPIGGGATQSNFTSSGMALTPANFETAYVAMSTFKSYYGNEIEVAPNVLVVPPALKGAAIDIVANATLPGGGSNKYFNWAKVVVMNKLQSQPGTWYLLATESAAVAPFIVQERMKPVFEAKDKDTDDNAFFRDEYLYGIRSRYGAGYGLWQLAYKAAA